MSQIKNVFVEKVKVGLVYSAKQTLGVELHIELNNLHWTEFINIWDLPDLLDILEIDWIGDLEGKPIRIECENFMLGGKPPCTKIGHIVKENWWNRPLEVPQSLLDAFNEYVMDDYEKWK